MLDIMGSRFDGGLQPVLGVCLQALGKWFARASFSESCLHAPWILGVLYYSSRDDVCSANIVEAKRLMLNGIIDKLTSKTTIANLVGGFVVVYGVYVLSGQLGTEGVLDRFMDLVLFGAGFIFGNVRRGNSDD